MRRALIWIMGGIALAALVVGIVLVSKTESASDQAAADPDSAASDYREALAGAPPKLAALYENGDELIAGGGDELARQLAAIRGHPAVVNVWASWCGPCRAEFPDFQRVAAERGDEVAFIGVDAQDADAAAETFLEELPLPYPSVTDPEQEVKEELNLRGYPATAFYSADGELVHLKQGPYTSAEELDADLDRYAG